MAKRERGDLGPSAVGVSSLLVIFAVLCLTVFTLLSLSTARANGRLSDASAQAVKDYYAADTAAQEVLARLRAGEAPQGVELTATIIEYPDHSETRYAYFIPMGEERELQVEVAMDGADYTVLRWQAVSTGEWSADDGLEIWDGVPF